MDSERRKERVAPDSARSAIAPRKIAAIAAAGAIAVMLTDSPRFHCDPWPCPSRSANATTVIFARGWSVHSAEKHRLLPVRLRKHAAARRVRISGGPLVQPRQAVVTVMNVRARRILRV